MVIRSNERLKPSKIRFIQESISSKFQNGDDIHNAITNIQRGILSPDDFPAIKVVRKDGKIYSFDNRRLYVFRVCEYRGHVTDIPVIIMPLSRLIDDRVTTENDGIKVRVRQGRTETHYSDRWLREKDDKGNRNLPPQRTTGRTSIDTVDGVSPTPIRVSNRSSRINDGSAYLKPSVYSISRSSNPQIATRQTATSPIHQSYSSITSQRILADNKPTLTSSNSDIYRDSYDDVLSTYLSSPYRSAHSRRLQIAANYGTDNHSYVPDNKRSILTSRRKPSTESTKSNFMAPKQPSIRSLRKAGVSRTQSSPSSKRTTANIPGRKVSDRTKGESLRGHPTVQSRPRATNDEDVFVRKTSLFRRFLRLCCCCCVRDTD